MVTGSHFDLYLDLVKDFGFRESIQRLERRKVRGSLGNVLGVSREVPERTGDGNVNDKEGEFSRRESRNRP